MSWKPKTFRPVMMNSVSGALSVNLLYRVALRFTHFPVLRLPAARGHTKRCACACCGSVGVLKSGHWLLCFNKKILMLQHLKIF